MATRLNLPTALLWLALLALEPGLRPLAAAPEPSVEESRDRVLCERVVASPLKLREAVGRSTAQGRVALAAGFALEGEDRLRLSVTTVGPREGASDFLEVSGLVSATGWDAQDHALTEVAAVAQAVRSQTLLELSKARLEDVIGALEAARRPQESRPTGVSIAARVVRLEGRTLGQGEVALEGAPWRVGVALAPQVSVVALVPPPYVAAREAAARVRVGRTLPPLDVKGARWLHVAAPPTWEGLRGSPVLVLLTNVNCEMECGPDPAVVSGWERRYGPLGLKVLTLYRDRVEWKQEVSFEAMAEHLLARKSTHPVMLDLLDRYIEALEPGPVGYPVAYVLDRQGVVAWEADTGRLDFAELCEKALLDVLAAKAPGREAPGR